MQLLVYTLTTVSHCCSASVEKKYH